LVHNSISERKPGFWRRLERSIRKRRKLVQARIAFDRDWYLKEYPDVSSRGIDPWKHYSDLGRQEGRGINSKSFLTGSYHEWIRKNDQITNSIREEMEREIANMAHRPVLSVIVPVYNPQPEWLIQALESVLNQIYPHWELCIADECSTDRRIRGILEMYSKRDPRIHVIFRKTNEDFASAFNSALDRAQGDFVALLDHDDTLPDHALYWVVEAIHRNPKAQLLYSDCDSINENGNRCPGYFKPDFNYELLLAQNYVGHLGVFSRELICGIGGFRKGYASSQDWDLALRVSATVPYNQIVHIPRILYHQRNKPLGVSHTSTEKCFGAGRRAVTDHLQSVGGGSVEAAPGCPGFHRIRFPLPTALPLISIIICTRDHATLLRKATESIHLISTYTNYEIVIVDNGSQDPEAVALLASLSKRAGTRVIRDDLSYNFSRLSNEAVAISKGEVICLLNNDIEVLTPDWLEEMLSFAIKPDVGAVGARLWYPDGTLQHGGVILGFGGSSAHAHHRLPKGNPGYFGRAVLQQELSAVTGACLMVRRKVFDEVGGLDEQLPVDFNDVDFCLRLRAAGYRNIWTPFAELIHHESATRGKHDNPEKITRFQQETHFMKMRWGKTVEQDPFYNPNLSTTAADYSISIS
jgi:O-antigen biosynthesis protein